MSVASEQNFQALAYPLRVDRQAGRLAKERDYHDHIKGLVRQVLLTTPTERVHRANFGAGLRSYIFSNLQDESVKLVEARIIQELEEWLNTLIVLENVRARSEAPNRLIVDISYRVRDTQKNDYLEFTLEGT